MYSVFKMNVYIFYVVQITKLQEWHPCKLIWFPDECPEPIDKRGKGWG